MVVQAFAFQVAVPVPSHRKQPKSASDFAALSQVHAPSLIFLNHYRLWPQMVKDYYFFVFCVLEVP